MSKRIAITGMGWLGLPLASHFQNLGFAVKGSVTRKAKATSLVQNGFDVHVIQLTDSGIKGNIGSYLSQVDILMIMVPPGIRRNTGTDFVLKMAYLLEAIQKSEIKKILLVSSTSVYGDSQGRVTEKTLPRPETEAGKQLLQVEQLFFNTPPIKTTIVRFGGLYGGSRQPVRYLAGRENLRGGNAPVNLIHRDDCIGIITAIVQQDKFGEIFNAVMPAHPVKSSYYANQAEALGLVPPHYSTETENAHYKQVDSERIEQLLGYKFQHSL